MAQGRSPLPRMVVPDEPAGGHVVHARSPAASDRRARRVRACGPGPPVGRCRRAPARGTGAVVPRLGQPTRSRRSVVVADEPRRCARPRPGAGAAPDRVAGPLPVPDARAVRTPQRAWRRRCPHRRSVDPPSARDEGWSDRRARNARLAQRAPRGHGDATARCARARVRHRRGPMARHGRVATAHQRARALPAAEQGSRRRAVARGELGPSSPTTRPTPRRR